MPNIFLKNFYQCGAIIPDKSLKQSIIPAKLIQSYVAAHYQANIDSNTLTLYIGQHCEPLSRLMKASDVQCALYITAYNPYSQPQHTETNLAANNQLLIRLSYHSSYIFEGKSLDPTGKWPAEPSFLALGIDLVTSRILGRQFSQNAIVWIDKNATPKLILLR
jgi:hypothetical protein